MAVLAEPLRRRMLDALIAGELTAGDVERRLGVGQVMASKHLRVLREAGLVRVRRDGPRRIYSIDARPLAEIDTWLARYRHFWECALDGLARHLDGEA